MAFQIALHKGDGAAGQLDAVCTVSCKQFSDFLAFIIGHSTFSAICRVNSKAYMHVHVVFYGSYYLENYSCTIQGVSTIIICSLVEIWIYKSGKIKIVSHVDLNSIKPCKREFFSSHYHFCLESSYSLDADVVGFDFLIVSIIVIEWSQLAQYWNIVFMGYICNFLIILYEAFMVDIVAILCKTVS